MKSSRFIRYIFHYSLVRLREKNWTANFITRLNKKNPAVATVTVTIIIITYLNPKY